MCRVARQNGRSWGKLNSEYLLASSIGDDISYGCFKALLPIDFIVCQITLMLLKDNFFFFSVEISLGTREFWTGLKMILVFKVNIKQCV